MSPAEKSLRGRLGAYAVHARYDGREITAAARKKFLDRFERIVDPEGKLTAAERARRAEIARKEYFTRLGMKSAKARRARAKK